MKRRSFIQKAGAAGFICFLDPLELVQTPGETPINNLEANFLTPTTKSYPYTYWFWMNGNISKEGITLDLEAMKRVGIAGVFNFDVGTGIPKGPIDYLSKEWLALKKHAMKECNRLGIEFTLHNCPGWSASGGPWITAELAMQQLSWSETYLAGGKTIHHRIPQPPSRLDYYRDIAVLAFPSLEGEELLQTMKARSPQGAVLPGQITGLDQDGAVVRPATGETTAWLELEFNQPYEASMITFFISSPENNTTETKLAEFSERTSIILEASDDGSSFRRIVQIPTGLETELLSGNKFISFDFIPTKAKYFRLSSTKPRRYRQVQFSGITRLKNWMEKTNHRARYLMFVDEPSTISHTNNQRVPPGFIIDYNKIVVLTDHMDKEGMLNWEAPPGNWTILRIGYTPTGTLNRAAPQTGIGLECDKYSREAMRFHFKKITEQFIPEMKALAAKGKMGLEIDSYEAGTQNWTAGFEKEFFKKWNYELVKYMAILAGGRIVDSVDKTERFLWDFRQVQANMIANNYYGQFYELCKQHGIISYIEPYEMGPMEEMQIGAGADINVGEFWNGISSVLPVKHPARRTARLAASIAHINNQSIVGAEAFTAEPDSGKWQEHPFAMKAIGDKVFTQGVNRMIFHRFAHQPHPTAVPGMTMGPWGIHFDRTTTWWNQAKPWLRYLSRCQWLLQQGRMVADLVYFTGEDANMYTRVMPDELCPTPPAGYAYDLVNADSLLQAQVLNQELLLPNGSRYRVMVFQDYHALSLPLLRKLKDLVNQGLVMVGEKPTRSTGLANYHDGDTEFLTIVEELWKNIDGKSTKHTIGRGQVIWGQSLEKVLASLSPGPDFTASSGRGKPPVIYTHRQTAEAEIYFISNQKRSVEEITARFRVNGKQPELWDPASGNITKAIFYEPINGFTHVPLQLEPYGSVFVIFREPAINNPFVSLEKDETILITTRPLAYTPPLYADHQNSFSICFWAKPEINVLLKPSFNMGNTGIPWTEFYAIYPSPGLALYGEGHACCGITAGRNGVAIWEHAKDSPVLALAAPAAIAGWSHIAILYSSGIPSVYINGKLAATGDKSNFIIHPSLGEASLQEGASFYNGDMTEPELYNEVLDHNRINQLSSLLPAYQYQGSRVVIRGGKKPALLFSENGSYTLRKKDTEKTILVKGIEAPFSIGKTWQLHFQPDRGAPLQASMNELISLHRHPDPGIRYYSGTVRYITSFIPPKQLLTAGKYLELDLGRVEIIAEVLLNGKNIGLLWKPPFRIPIHHQIKEGTNHLEIRVTNLWPNRLIGDEQLPDPDLFTAGAGASGLESLSAGAIEKLPGWYMRNQPKPSDGRICFSTWKHYTKESPLLESGLIGPVAIYSSIEKTLD